MDYSVMLCLVLVVGLFAAMTTDVILDIEQLWINAGDDKRGSGRVEFQKVPSSSRKADLSWVNLVEDLESETQVDVVALAKSKRPKIIVPTVYAGDKVRALLDGLGKKIIDRTEMTIRELKALCKKHKVKGYGNMRKAELVLALEGLG
jgi:hypothetical protein